MTDLTTAEAAALLGLARDTLLNWATSGDRRFIDGLAPVKRFGRWYFDRERVLAFKEQMSMPASGKRLRRVPRRVSA